MAEETIIANAGGVTPPAGGGTVAPTGAGGGSGSGNDAPPSQTPPAAAPPAGSLATGGVTDAPPPPATWPQDWRSQLAGDDKAYLKTLERFESPAAMAKSYRELQGKVSSGSLKAPPPAADAAPEELATWRKENGIPEAPAQYVEKLALPNGMVLSEADQPIVAQFAEQAFADNLDPKAFSGLVAKYYAIQDAQAQQRQETDNTFKMQAQDTLNKEWGPEFRSNINSVSNLLAQAPDGVKDRLFAGRTADGQVIGNDPQVLRWLAGIAREINPMGTLMPAGTSDPGKAGNARIAEIEGIMKGPDSNTKYWKDAAIQEEYRQLLTAREAMAARGG